MAPRKKTTSPKKAAPRKVSAPRKPAAPKKVTTRKPAAKKPAMRRRAPEPLAEPVQLPVAQLPPPITNPFQG